MRSSSLCLLLLTIQAFARKATTTTTAKPAPAIDPLKHDVLILNEKNFHSGITKFRDRFPAAVLFHAGDQDAELNDFIEGQWNNYARQLKGLARLGAVDCNEFPTICRKEIGGPITGSSRQVMVYPPIPVPSYKFDEDVSKLPARMLKLLPPATITELSDEASLALFFNQAPGVPKVVLFTDKKRIAPLYHGLAHNMGDRMNFGIVKEASLTSPLATRMRVRKIPTLMLKKGDMGLNLKGVTVYPKPDMTYESIHEWLNIHSETFVKGGGFMSDDELKIPVESNKPWRADRLPKMTKASHNDLCFKKPTGLCAIYLRSGEDIGDDEVAMIESVRDHFLTKPGSPQFFWSWMDMSQEKSFAKLFQLYNDDGELEASRLPTLAIFNPHKRLRFQTLTGTRLNNKEAIEFIDRIIAGDGRFKVLKGNTLPGFYVPPKNLKSNDEL